LGSEIELGQVLVTDEMGRYLFAKSLLDRDSIEYLLRGDTLRMSHGLTETPLTDTPVEPVEFWVRSADADRARLLLRELDAKMPGPGAFNSDA
jgi:hypothetical protein